MFDLIDVSFIIPELVKQGLDSGVYERVGEVIRETASKNVVHWLREGKTITKGHKIIVTLSSPGCF